MTPDTLTSHRQNRSNSAALVVSRLRAQPAVLAEAKVVGRWVWIMFPTRPAQDVLTFLQAEGFRWNPKRRAWQHSGGFPTRTAPYDPRAKYGEVDAAQLLAHADGAP